MSDFFGLICMSLMLFPGSVIIIGLIKMSDSDPIERKIGKDIIKWGTGYEFSERKPNITQYKDLYQARHNYRTGKISRDEYERAKDVLQ